MHYLDIERLDIDIEENKKDSFWSSFGEKDEQIRILHYRKVSKISDIFTAPSHINPFHVTATRVRKFIPGFFNSQCFLVLFYMILFLRKFVIFQGALNLYSYGLKLLQIVDEYQTFSYRYFVRCSPDCFY